MKTISLFVAALAIGIAGCGATTPVPADKLTRSQAVVRSAEEMNASSDPRAAMHLKLAKDQLAEGKALMKEGDNKKASLVLLRAEADGEAALNLARAHYAQMDAQRTIEQVRQAMIQAQEGRGS
jgi:hypothetical protein